MDELFNAVMHVRTLERIPDGKIFKWMRSIIDNWREDSDYRKDAEELMARAIQRLDGVTFQGDIKTNPRQIHQNILTSAGIDPEEEPWASLIELALRDDDPTRVLIDCEHRDIMSHPVGDPMLVRLALERANPKIMVCNRIGIYTPWPAVRLTISISPLRQNTVMPVLTGFLVPRLGRSTMSRS